VVVAEDPPAGGQGVCGQLPRRRHLAQHGQRASEVTLKYRVA